MSNWNERANQERQRQAADAAALKQASDANTRRLEETSKQQANDRKDFLLRKIDIYDQLGVPRVLEEIKRDVWKGWGQIERHLPSVSLEKTGFSSAGNRLHMDIPSTFAKTEPNLMTHYGEYNEMREHIRGGSYVNRRLVGDHTHYLGDVITGATEETKTIADLSIVLTYREAGSSNTSPVRNLPAVTRKWPSSYTLSVNGDSRQFEDADPSNSRPTLDVKSAITALDQMLLNYAVLAENLPDFAKIKSDADARKQLIQRSIGKYKRDVPGL